MNLELLDPFGQHCPELVDGTLSNGDITLCCRFNYRGNLLATGTLDGACVVWDMDTKSIARSMTGHVQPVNSVSWSKSGRYLLTASTDWNCILWDLKDGSRARTIRFGCPIESAQMHSTKNNIFIVVLQSGGAVLIKLAESFGGPVQRSNFAGYYEGDRSGMTQIREERCRSACFDPTGEQVLIGTQKGQVVILDTETFSIMSVFRACGAGIRGLQFDSKGCDLVVNANDKTIRVFTLRRDGEKILLENEQRFQDSVNHLPWVQSSFSADGEFVLGGSDVKHAHRIYMWNRHVGNLVKVLDGEKDGLMDFAAHPFKPMLASVGTSGLVYIWTANYKQRYSTLAPDFDELEDNVEYEERESEFDEDEDELVKKPKEDYPAGDEDIDICTIAHVNVYDDGDNVGAFVLPIDLDQPQESMPKSYEEPIWQWHIPV